jgi:hypothetical protein
MYLLLRSADREPANPYLSIHSGKLYIQRADFMAPSGDADDESTGGYGS